MQPRGVLASVLVTACYAPAANPGAPCGPGGECPSGQECRAGTCFAVSTPFDASLDQPDSSQITIDAPADAMALGAWSTPVAIPSLAAGGGESDPSITANRLIAVFAANPVATDPDDLYIGTRASTSDPFTVAPLTVLNTTSDEQSPEISSDGQTLYFTSDRSGNYQVYKSTRTNNTWAAPTLVSELSTANADSDLAVSPDRLTALVLDETGSNRLILHTRASTADPFGAGVVQTSLAITTDLAAPTITNGAATVYFHAGTTRDLYVAHRKTDGTYEMPVPVTELNTTGRDAAPFVLQSDRYMLFDRNGAIFESSR